MKERKLRLAALVALALKVASLFTGCSIDADEKNNSTAHGQVKESSSIVETYQQEIEKGKIEVKRDSITVSNVPIGTKLTLKGADSYEISWTASDMPERFEHLKPGKYNLTKKYPSELGLSNETVEVEVPHFYPYDPVGILSNLDSNAVEKIIYTTNGADNPFIKPDDDEQKYVLADIKYLPDGTCTIGVFTDSKIEYPVNYSPTIDGSFEADYLIEGVDPEEEAEKYLLPLLNGKYYLTDVFEKGDSYKTATLYSENHAYASAKVCYSYNDDEKISKTEYYDEYGFMYMSEDQREDHGIVFSVQTWYNRDTKEKEEEIWKSLDNNISFTRKFYTTKNGFKYEITFSYPDIATFGFYDESGNFIKNSETIIQYNSYETVTIDDSGALLKIDIESESKCRTYSIDKTGIIAFYGTREYEESDINDNAPKNPISIKNIYLHNAKTIYDNDKNPVATVKCYYGYNEENGETILDGLPVKTIIESDRLEKPIEINYSYSKNSMGSIQIDSRPNQSSNVSNGFWVDPDAEINQYLNDILSKDKKSKHDITTYRTHDQYYFFERTGELKTVELEISQNGLPTYSKRTDFGTNGKTSRTLTDYKENGEKKSVIYYKNDTLYSYSEYLTSKNGCKYKDTSYYEEIDYTDPYYGTYNRTLAFYDPNGDFNNTFIETSGTLHKHNVGDLLVIDIQSYHNGMRTRTIYEINPSGQLQYQTIIMELSGCYVTVIRESSDNDGMITYYENQEYELQDFNMDVERKYLPWLDEYDGSWKKLAKDNDGLSYIGTITPDASLQSSTLTAPDGELTTWELPGETFSEGANHILKRL